MAITEHLVTALAEIARGRHDCGRPFAAEVSRQIARKAFIECRVDWTEIAEADRARKP